MVFGIAESAGSDLSRKVNLCQISKKFGGGGGGGECDGGGSGDVCDDNLSLRRRKQSATDSEFRRKDSLGNHQPSSETPSRLKGREKRGKCCFVFTPPAKRSSEERGKVTRRD